MLDVIVVGAGPSGAVLSYLLARRGVQVMLLEKDFLPRYKTCGGGITWKTVRNLPFDASPAYEQRARGGILSYKGKQLLRADLDWTVAWTVMRSKFDYFLVKKAIEAGAQFMDGVRVTDIDQQENFVIARSPKGDFQSRILAGADGVNSVVAKSQGLLGGRKTGVGIEAEVTVPDRQMQEQSSYATFDFGATPRGYGWIFPKQDHLSVGVFHASAKNAPDMRQVLEGFISSHPVLQGAKQIHVQGHRIPIGDAKQILHMGRTLLVGDAANLADAWLGEGINYAILSAHLAADGIYAALRDDRIDLSSYTHQIQQQIAPQFARARQLSNLVFTMPELCSILTSRSPRMQELIFSAIRGNRTYRQMMDGLVMGVPRILIDSIFNQRVGRY